MHDLGTIAARNWRAAAKEAYDAWQVGDYDHAMEVWLATDVNANLQGFLSGQLTTFVNEGR